MLHVFCAIPRHKSCVLHWFKPAYVPWIFQRAHDVRTTCRSCYRCSLFLSCCKLHVCAGLSLLCPPLGEGDAEDAWLQRSEDVNTDHRTVHGRPSAGAVETAGHHHDRQVQTALGWAGWERETHCTYCPINVHTPLCLDGFSKNRHKGVVFLFLSRTHLSLTAQSLSHCDWWCIKVSLWITSYLMHRAETLNVITSAVFSDSSHYILSWCDRVPLAVLSLGLIHPVVLLTDVLYLQQSTSSQAAKPAGSSPGQ